MRFDRLLLASTACALVAGAALAQTTTTNTTSAQPGAGASTQPGAAGATGDTTSGMSNTTSSGAGTTTSSGMSNATGATTSASGASVAAASASAPFQRVTPAAGANLLAVLQASGQFTTLIKAITATNLTSVLQRPGSLTIFAPTDAAFAALPAGQLDTLMQPANASQLQQFVLLHAVNTPISSAQLLNHGAINLPTVATDKKVHLDGSSGAIKVDDANVLQADVKASNGTIFVIDKALSPTYAPPPVAATPAAAAAATTPTADTKATTTTTTKRKKR